MFLAALPAFLTAFPDAFGGMMRRFSDRFSETDNVVGLTLSFYLILADPLTKTRIERFVQSASAISFEAF
jgi:hypothetical protein